MSECINLIGQQANKNANKKSFTCTLAHAMPGSKQPWRGHGIAWYGIALHCID